MLSENFVYVAILLGIVGQVSYLVETVRGNTRPNRVSFFIWAVAPLLAFAGAIDEHVGKQVLMTFIVGFGPACILVASFLNPNAYWKITRLDLACGALSVCGLVVWLLTQEGTLAIGSSIIADGLASLPTLIKAYKHPDTEHSWAYWTAGGNAFITMLTIDHWNFAHYGFPLYILAMSWMIALSVTVRGPAQRAAAAAASQDEQALSAEEQNYGSISS